MEIKRVNSRLLPIGMLLLAVIICFIGLSSYSLLVDETYQALCCKNYLKSPLAMMIFYVGNKWMCIFGDTLISLRVLSRICILLSIGVGGGYLWSKTKDPLITSLACLLSAIFFNLGDMSFYNWDTGAYPIASLGTLVLLSYIDKYSALKLMILGLLTGAMIAFRVPLIGFTAIVAIVIVVNNNVITVLKRYTIYFLSTSVGLIVCAWIMTGSILDYLQSFNDDNIISRHTGNILLPYYNQFINFFPRNIFCGMMTLIPILFTIILSFVRQKRFINWILCQFFIIVIGISCVLQYVTPSNAMLSGIGIPLFFAAVAWLYITKALWAQKGEMMSIEGNVVLKLSVLIMSMLLLGLGSDTAFQRWNIIAYFPMALGVIWPLVQEESGRVLKKTIYMTLPVLFIVMAFKFYWVEIHVSRIDVVGRFKGVKCETEMVHNYLEIRDLVEKLNAKGVSYAFAGPGPRYLYAYEFEDNNNILFPLHSYHWEDGNYEVIEKFCRKCDVIIYVSNYQKDFEKLNELYGYGIIEKTSAYTLCGDLNLNNILGK